MTTTNNTPEKRKIDNEFIENTILSIQKQSEELTLSVPSQFNIGNEFKFAYLVLKDLEVKSGNNKGAKATDVCNAKSVYNALLKMASTGLHISKGHCHFEVRDDKVTLMEDARSWEFRAKRDCGVKYHEINVVYEGDQYETGVNYDTGARRVTKHISPFKNRENKIIGAYIYVHFTDGSILFFDYTYKQIEQAWLMGYRGKQLTDVHKNFPEEMARKTVISKTYRQIVNADSSKSMTIPGKQQTEDADFTEITEHEDLNEEYADYEETSPVTTTTKQESKSKEIPKNDSDVLF